MRTDITVLYFWRKNGQKNTQGEQKVHRVNATLKVQCHRNLVYITSNKKIIVQDDVTAAKFYVIAKCIKIKVSPFNFANGYDEELSSALRTGSKQVIQINMLFHLWIEG